MTQLLITGGAGFIGGNFVHYTLAPRPLQSTLNLDKIKTTGFVPRDWKQALSEYLKNE